MSNFWEWSKDVSFVNRFIFPAPKPSSYNKDSFPDELLFVPPRDKLYEYYKKFKLKQLNKNKFNINSPKYNNNNNSQDNDNDNNNNKSDNKDEFCDDDAIPCIYIERKYRLSEATHLLLYLHGNAEDLGKCYPIIDYIRMKLPVNILAPEYPGYGVSSGESNENSVIEMVQNVYEFAISPYGLNVPPQRIIIYGFSIGSAAALSHTNFNLNKVYIPDNYIKINKKNIKNKNKKKIIKNKNMINNAFTNNNTSLPSPSSSSSFSDLDNDSSSDNDDDSDTDDNDNDDDSDDDNDNDQKYNNNASSSSSSPIKIFSKLNKKISKKNLHKNNKSNDQLMGVGRKYFLSTFLKKCPHTQDEHHLLFDDCKGGNGNGNQIFYTSDINSIMDNGDPFERLPLASLLNILRKGNIEYPTSVNKKELLSVARLNGLIPPLLSCKKANIIRKYSLLVIVCPFASISQVVSDKIGVFASYLLSERFKNIEAIKKVHGPLLIIHGKDDSIIPYQHSIELHKTAIACDIHPAELELLDGCDHNTMDLRKITNIINKSFKHQFNLCKSQLNRSAASASQYNNDNNDKLIPKTNHNRGRIYNSFLVSVPSYCWLKPQKDAIELTDEDKLRLKKKQELDDEEYAFNLFMKQLLQHESMQNASHTTLQSHQQKKLKSFFGDNQPQSQSQSQPQLQQPQGNNIATNNQLNSTNNNNNNNNSNNYIYNSNYKVNKNKKKNNIQNKSKNGNKKVNNKALSSNYLAAVISSTPSASAIDDNNVDNIIDASNSNNTNEPEYSLSHALRLNPDDDILYPDDDMDQIN